MGMYMRVCACGFKVCVCVNLSVSIHNIITWEGELYKVGEQIPYGI